MPKWTNDSGRRVTFSSNTAIKSFNDTDVWSNEQPQPQLQKNLGNKIIDPQARKAALTDLEGEPRQHPQDETNLSNEKKHDAEADLLKHLDIGGHKKLQDEIEKSIARAEQLAAQISVASHTCSGARLQNTGAENGSPSPVDAAAPGSSGPSGGTAETPAQVISQLQDAGTQTQARDIVQKEDTQAWRANMENAQRISSYVINMIIDRTGEMTRSIKLLVEHVNRLEAQLASSSSRIAGQQRSRVNQADCISQDDLNSSAGQMINRQSASPSTNSQYRSYESGFNNSQAAVQRNRWEGFRQVPGLDKERMYAEMEWEVSRAIVIAAVMTTVQPFSGNPLDYPAFISRFEAMTNHNILIDVETKQVMLLALLPEKLRQEYQTSELSEERYGLTRRNLDRQFNRPTAQSTRMPKQLNNMKHNTVQVKDDRQVRSQTPSRRVVPKFTPPCRQLPCAFCTDPKHGATVCTLLPKQKKEAAKEKKLCYNCLSKSHTVAECSSGFNCAKCQGRHFTGLCTNPRTSDNHSGPNNVDMLGQREDDEESELQPSRGEEA